MVQFLRFTGLLETGAYWASTTSQAVSSHGRYCRLAQQISGLASDKVGKKNQEERHRWGDGNKTPIEFLSVTWRREGKVNRSCLH